MAPQLFSLMEPKFKDEKCVWEGASIRVQVVGGYYVVTVSCPTAEKQARFVCASLATLVADIEENVLSSKTPWLPDFAAQKRARREARV